jgi:RNA polymerase sigma factor (sigma-70 family)
MTPLLSSGLLRVQTDDRLVELAAAGHDRAFEAIVERYRRPLLRYLRRLLSDTLAEDVVQATFISAWTSLRTGTEVRDLRPWLYRIAHNAAINALKKVGEAMEEVPESLGGFASEPAAELERRDEMQRALTSIAALPSRQRAALLAIAVDGRAHSDVAAELGLTDGAVRQLVHRARITLRSAATAITPTPLLHALMTSAGDSTVGRVAEVAAGAGGAGAASLSLKAGAAAVLATGALVTGAPRIAHVVHPSARATEPAAQGAPPSSTATVAPASVVTVTAGAPGATGPTEHHAAAAPRGSPSSSSAHRSRSTPSRHHRRHGGEGSRGGPPSPPASRHRGDGGTDRATPDAGGRSGLSPSSGPGAGGDGSGHEQTGHDGGDTTGHRGPGSGSHGADDAAGRHDGGAQTDGKGGADDLVVPPPAAATTPDEPDEFDHGGDGHPGPTPTTTTPTTPTTPPPTVPAVPTTPAPTTTGEAPTGSSGDGGDSGNGGSSANGSGDG